ncbi:MAG: hypothetical protein JO028_01105 [Acidobacteriaceae bacterium]|nr:hypothetical protein [Acidobacteriaceae bacterium]
MLAYDNMNELSQEFGRELFLVFPDWERLAQDILDDKTGVHYLEVNIPQEGSERQLHLSTADHEITIAFDQWHTRRALSWNEYRGIGGHGDPHD